VSSSAAFRDFATAVIEPGEGILPLRASGGMADALASGASVRKDVGVQVPPRAQEVFRPYGISSINENTVPVASSRYFGVTLIELGNGCV